MATVSQQPYELNTIFYPGSKASLRIIKSGFPVGAVLTALVQIGKGDDLSDLKQELQPEVKTPAALQSEIVWTGAKTRGHTLPDYTIEIAVNDEIITSGYVKASREKSETEPTGEPIVFDWKGDQRVIIRPPGSNEPILLPVSEAVKVTVDAQDFYLVKHGLSCDALVGWGINANGAVIPSSLLRPLAGDAARPVRDWAFLDTGGADIGDFVQFAFIPFYQ